MSDVVETNDVMLTSADGVRLAATTWCRSDVVPAAAVVVVHGMGIDRTHHSVVGTVTALVAAGFAVVACDGRGHGASGGLCSLGSAEVHDVAAAVALAGRFSPAVVAVGSSLGGIAVLRYAATTTALAGVVSVSAPATWQIHSARSLLAAALTRTAAGRRALHRRSGVRISPSWDGAPPPASAAALVRCPTALVHGTRDRFIPPREAIRLFDRLNEPRRLSLVDGMAHGFGPAAEPAIVEAVRWALGTAATATPAAATTTPARPDPGRYGRSSPR
jgi:alpha-beta hydrolase superfamily lysophospholipase